MTYDHKIDRNSPGCLVFLVDQSASMAEPIAGAEQSKASAVADQLNGLLFELVQRCSKAHGEPPRAYFSIAVIGYRTNAGARPIVESCLSEELTESQLVTTTDLALAPRRLEDRKRNTPSGTQTTFRFPVWIDPVSQGGTPMCKAFDVAGAIVRSWVDEHVDGFPPIIINLTDGEATDGDPIVWADRIRGLKTSDGGVLLFNVAISSEAHKPVMFPHSDDAIDDKYGKALFSISSPLPEFMLTAARMQNIEVQPGSRGFALNADFQAVMTFLNIGTQVSQLLR